MLETVGNRKNNTFVAYQNGGSFFHTVGLQVTPALQNPGDSNRPRYQAWVPPLCQTDC